MKFGMLRLVGAMSLMMVLSACGGEGTTDAGAGGQDVAVDGSGGDSGGDSGDSGGVGDSSSDSGGVGDSSSDSGSVGDSSSDSGGDSGSDTADDAEDSGSSEDTVADTEADTAADAVADTVADTAADAVADSASVDDGSAADCGSGCDVLAPGGDVVGDAESDGTGPDTTPAPPALATLAAEKQTIASPYDTVTIKAAALPVDAKVEGKLRLTWVGGPDDGKQAGTAPLLVGKSYDELAIQISPTVLGTQKLVAEILGGDGKVAATLDGGPMQAVFEVTGDTEEPELKVESQALDPADLYALTIAYVNVPARFKVGGWVAIYTNNAGKPGTLLGKAYFKPGAYKDQPLAMTSKLLVGQPLHAVMIEPAAGSGSWKSSNPPLQDLDGNDVATTFIADSVAYHPILEIEDQTLSNPKELLIQKVTVPQEHFGGWLAIYDDNAGKPGALLGKLYFVKGTKENQVLKFTDAQQGEKTLHAILYAGQKWDEQNNVVMQAPGGGEMTLTFKVGAASLSYILAPPYTTDDPRHVVVKRAYSFDKPAWVVLARDDGTGKPGEVIAQKKVAKKFAGDVHVDALYGNFIKEGSLDDYLVGKAGTSRRCVRGDEKIHVLLYEDDPADNAFTYVPGGKEDVPVLDANNKAVTAVMDVQVKAAIQNNQKDSPRYYAPCPLSQHIANATKLPVDCRCHTNVVGHNFPECKLVIADIVGMQYGEGPRARSQNFGRFMAGFTEPSSNELIGLIVWKDHETVWPENKITIDVGAVVAIDAETRKRRIIGGRHKDPQKGILDYGKGPVLSYPFAVQKGPDGKYYVASYGYVRIGASLTPGVDVIRMDPKTGDREYVWRSNHLGFNLDNQTNPYGHCANGRDAKYGYYSVQIGRKGFGIDDKGNFYLSYAHNGNTPTSDGIGILKVGSDGKSCDFVTRTKVGKDNVLYKGASVGNGPEPQAGPYKGLLWKDNKLYVSVELTDALWEVDVATGDRKPLHTYGVDDNNTGSSGTHIVWDDYRKLFWQMGFSSATLMYDPAKGTSEPLWCPENDRDYKGIACKKLGAWGNNGLVLERGFWMHPTSAEYMFVVNGNGIVRVHLKSGTSEIFSY
ncbi:MAG: hypothetical protein H6747_13970 [Deltaproteobacteria bacterium]|nr:hypothetical protein [Deltaproteobacteria bacterium]